MTSTATKTQSSPGPAIKVMSFNIRYGTANDGENHWNKRQNALLKAITSFEPDLLCTQETLAMQRDFLQQNLPNYGCIGVGRDDGKEAGEMTAIYFKKDRFAQIETGHFWLSPTPEIAGSVGWDAALSRMASWIKLVDQDRPESRPILLINAHLDHRGRQSRIESCKLILNRAFELGTNCRIIIAGDFNCTEDDPAYTALLGNKLVDVYRAIHPVRQVNEITFHDFKPQNTNGSRIDWIMADQNFKPQIAEIDRQLYEGRIPSDHFPVTAVLE